MVRLPPRRPSHSPWRCYFLSEKESNQRNLVEIPACLCDGLRKGGQGNARLRAVTQQGYYGVQAR